jgi:glycosyltransferase involved in cell wall biosynthesis
MSISSSSAIINIEEKSEVSEKKGVQSNEMSGGLKGQALPLIDHSKTETARVRKTEDGDIVLDFPEDKIDRVNLPPVTIVTITCNRKRFAELAINNWKRIYYPDNKLTWLVIDDSSDPKTDGFIEPLKALKDPRIKYYYLAPKREDDQITYHTIGYKRNFAMGLVTSEIVCFMDDDDYLFDESVLARVCCLRFYGKQCVYSADLGVYNVVHENSYFLEGFADVPEGSIMLTKEFWKKQKFGEEPQGEGRQLVSGQEANMIKIPSHYSLIVLQHGSNTTGGGRSIRFKMDRKMMEKKSIVNPIDFWKDNFPVGFREAVNRANPAHTRTTASKYK